MLSMCIVDLGWRRQHDPLRAAPSARGEAIPVDSPLSRLVLTFVFLAACVLFCTRSEAHPVAQGALEIVIFPERVLVRAMVSNEEVLVAAAGEAKGARQQLPYLETVRNHGEYLLAHFRITADARLLDGRVIEVPERAAGRPVYDLEYRLTGGAPASIGVQQDVLREFEFAPGNRWEASYLVRIGEIGQPAREGLLLTYAEPLRFEPGARSAAGTPAAPQLDQARMAVAFMWHGIMHILTGYDHLLFVGALLLAISSLWDLVKVISAFTLAHTITLVLAVLDIVRVPSGVVEPMIAGSIVFVATQNLFWPERSRGWSRLSVAFLFGLFHGLGFAGGFLDAMSGMQAVSAAVALVAFSAGVEIGHQVVVLPVFGGLHLLRRASAGGARREGMVRRYGSVAVSLFGIMYLVAALR
jgi:HupE / UreJ protein